jgi:hypothetical protein
MGPTISKLNGGGMAQAVNLLLLIDYGNMKKTKQHTRVF